MIHKGKKLEEAVNKYHPNKTELARKLKYKARSSLYDQFEKDHLDDWIILNFAQAMGVSLKKEFPEVYKKLLLLEPEMQYEGPKTVDSLQAQLDLVRDMLMESQQEVIKLQRELMEERAKKK